MVGAGALTAAGALALAAEAAGPFDGTYTGQADLIRGNNGSMCKTFATSISVTDGHLTYVHGRCERGSDPAAARRGCCA